jgi:hypothetical protein
MADALALRNHLIEQFERADATADPGRRRGCLTVVIGSALVGFGVRQHARRESISKRA